MKIQVQTRWVGQSSTKLPPPSIFFNCSSPFSVTTWINVLSHYILQQNMLASSYERPTFDLACFKLLSKQCLNYNFFPWESGFWISVFGLRAILLYKQPSVHCCSISTPDLSCWHREDPLFYKILAYFFQGGWGGKGGKRFGKGCK